MTEELATKIEAYLLERKGWVSAAELSERFAIRPRAFRQLGERVGLCSEFAISGDKGYRHVGCATETEWERFYARLGEHAIGELRRRRGLRLRRVALLKPRAPRPTTRDGQELLFSPEEEG